MSSNPELADIIFRALLARRELLRTGEGARRCASSGRATPRRRWRCARSRRGRSSRTAGSTSRTPTTSASCSPSMGLRPGDTPGRDHSRPQSCAIRHRASSPSTSASRSTARPATLFDLVVVGSGPAGLAAAVYGASEGLDTVVARRGRRPAVRRARARASRTTSASRTASPARSSPARRDPGAAARRPAERAVRGRGPAGRSTGSTWSCWPTGARSRPRRSIIASGARYQRLAVAGLERFEGAGVYYAATDLEARVCSGSDVMVVGGGNSAGQAAIYLAQQRQPGDDRDPR